MKMQSIKMFVAQQGIVSINPTVRENVNKFPFITTLDKDGKAENLYFSKSSATQVAVGQVLTKDEFKNMSVAEVENEAGETRLKLTFSSYMSVDDLLG